MVVNLYGTDTSDMVQMPLEMILISKTKAVFKTKAPEENKVQSEQCKKGRG